MIGHCGGLRQSQSIGDYVLAHAYMRRDGILDRVLPPNIPLPALAEVQQALQESAAKVTGEQGEALTPAHRHRADLRRPQLGTALGAGATADQPVACRCGGHGERHHRRPGLPPTGAVRHCCCVSDKPLHSEIKLPGSANAFYERAVTQHLKIGITALELLRNQLNSLLAQAAQLRRAAISLVTPPAFRWSWSPRVASCRPPGNRRSWSP